jgi:L,D-peptidoglycan transpeptidase YkuD (ErfK/YbiS/YcfS/YnhG family)
MTLKKIWTRMRPVGHVRRHLLRLSALTGSGLLVLTFALGSRAAGLSPEIRQLVVSIAPDWAATHGTLQRFEQSASGKWMKVGDAVPVLYGKNGLAWGRGVLGTDEPGLRKAEGDGRAPAGVFELGTIYGNDDRLPDGADYPFRHVTAADAWIDDPLLPHYNEHVVVDPQNPPVWFEKQRMRLGDPAYRWLVEIRHNANPAEPGAGSAIFFHIRRGENRPTFGCTSMAEDNLRDLVCWLRASQHPHYALLVRADYERLWRAWGLPAPVPIEASTN